MVSPSSLALNVLAFYPYYFVKCEVSFTWWIGATVVDFQGGAEITLWTPRGKHGNFLMLTLADSERNSATYQTLLRQGEIMSSKANTEIVYALRMHTTSNTFTNFFHLTNNIFLYLSLRMKLLIYYVHCNSGLFFIYCIIIHRWPWSFMFHYFFVSWPKVL